MTNKLNWNDSSLLNHIATELGYHVEKIASKGNRHTIKISNGEKFYIASAGSYGYYPDNNRWHSALFKNKIHTKTILEGINYPCVKSYNYTIKESSLPGILEALPGLNLTFPLIIKPSQGMKGQGIKYLNNLEMLSEEVSALFTAGKDFCIQPIIKDSEYRVLYINNEVQLVHSKSHNSITGDGTKSVIELLSEKSKNLVDNAFLEQELRQGNLNRDSILAEDKTLKTHITKITHGDLVNEIYFKDSIPEAVTKWTEKLAKSLSVSVMGLDIFASDINDPSTYKIIEINSNPAFSYLVNKFNGYQQIREMWEETLRIYFSN
jgi:D-alanine-D-alanine ligase-like ATP-grasp enzyme